MTANSPDPFSPILTVKGLAKLMGSEDPDLDVSCETVTNLINEGKIPTLPRDKPGQKIFIDMDKFREHKGGQL